MCARCDHNTIGRPNTIRFNKNMACSACMDRLTQPGLFATQEVKLTVIRIIYLRDGTPRVFHSGHLQIFRCPIAHLRKNEFGSSLTG